MTKRNYKEASTRFFTLFCTCFFIVHLLTIWGASRQVVWLYVPAILFGIIWGIKGLRASSSPSEETFSKKEKIGVASVKYMIIILLTSGSWHRGDMSLVWIGIVALVIYAFLDFCEYKGWKFKR